MRPRIDPRPSCHANALGIILDVLVSLLILGFIKENIAQRPLDFRQSPFRFSECEISRHVKRTAVSAQRIAAWRCRAPKPRRQAQYKGSPDAARSRVSWALVADDRADSPRRCRQSTTFREM